MTWCVGWKRRRASRGAGIEKLHQQDIAATLSRDPVALTDLVELSIEEK